MRKGTERWEISKKEKERGQLSFVRAGLPKVLDSHLTLQMPWVATVRVARAFQAAFLTHSRSKGSHLQETEVASHWGGLTRGLLAVLVLPRVDLPQILGL